MPHSFIARLDPGLSRAVLAFLITTAGLGVACQAKDQPPVTTSNPPESIERVHQEVWRRFIDPHGIVIDYTGLNGEVHLPTPDECRDGKPNALGWWSPIENGGFFGGLYLDALCNRWWVTRSAEAAARARIVANGLVKLSEVSDTPGFIARGVSTDGRSHYPASSSDQTYPWFYGLWRYATSGLPDPVERSRIAATLERVAFGLEAQGWKMPCDRPGFGHFGHWSGGFAGTQGILSGAEPYFDATVRFLFVLRAVHEVTGNPRWLELYQRHAVEKPLGSTRTRLEICSAGVQYVAPGEPPRYPESPPIWTSASTQAGLRALREWESDPALRAGFQHGLDANAASAARFIRAYSNYDNENTATFDLQWRTLNASWTPQDDIGAAVKLGTLQYRAWNRQSPRKLLESHQMRDPLFAAWIVALAGNPALTAASRVDINGALNHYQWDRLYTCLFFMAENVHWQLQRDN
ncbi:MAG: hypothetical protein JNN01_07330 [Opitutaceae bacterium]|nr:hypothetical protein [Opitutaceae bacterium]